MHWRATVLAVLSLARGTLVLDSIKKELSSIEDHFNAEMPKLRTDFEFGLAQNFFKMAEEEKLKLSEHIRGMFVGMFLADAMIINYQGPVNPVQNDPPNLLKKGVIGAWSYRSERGMCMAVSLLILGEVNLCDQVQRYAQYLKRGYLASAYPQFVVERYGIEDDEAVGTAFEAWRHDATGKFLSANGHPAVTNLDAPEYCFQGRKDNGLLLLYAHLNKNFEEFKLNSEFRGNFMTCLAPLIIFNCHSTIVQVIEDVKLLVEEGATPRTTVHAVRVFALLLWSLLQGKTKDEILTPNFYDEYKAVLEIPETSEIWKMVRSPFVYTDQIAEDVRIFGANKPSKAISGIQNNASPGRRLEAALWVLTHDEENFEKGMEMVATLGGATKEIAMIYGMLAGACYGFTKIGADRWEMLSNQDYLGEVAVLLSGKKKAEEKCRSPAPRPTFDIEMADINLILNKPGDLETTSLRNAARKLFEIIENPETVRALGRARAVLLGLALGDMFYTLPSDPNGKSVYHDVLRKRGVSVPAMPPLKWTSVTSLALATAASLVTSRRIVGYDQMLHYLHYSMTGYFSSRDDYEPEVKKGTQMSLNKFNTWRIRTSEKIIDEEMRLGEINMLPFTRASMFFRSSISRRYGDLHTTLERKMAKFPSPDDPSENTPLIRVAVTAIFTFRRTIQRAIEAAEYICELTHCDNQTVSACKYYAALLWGALNGMNRDKILSPGFYTNYKHNLNLCKEIEDIAEGSYRDCIMEHEGDMIHPHVVSPPSGIEGDDNKTAAGALKAALWQLYFDTTRPFDGGEKLYNLKGDGSTIGAIYGALAGALTGEESQLACLLGNKLHAQNFIGDLAMLLCVADGLTPENLTPIVEEVMMMQIIVDQMAMLQPSDIPCKYSYTIGVKLGKGSSGKKTTETTETTETPETPTPSTPSTPSTPGSKKTPHNIPLIILGCVCIGLVIGLVVYVAIK